MALAIESQCTACGDCIPACPNGAISPARPIFRISALLCTECVGYAEFPACAAACPARAIVVEIEKCH